ncbi:MAG: potassium channel family protein [Steroidobacteraceae bacterium]
MVVTLIFGVTPLLSGVRFGSEISLGFYALIALSGVAAVARRADAVIATGICAAASIALDWIAYSTGSPVIEVLDVAVRALFIAAIAVAVVAQVFRPGNVTHHRVQGAIVVYLLAGLAWGYGYEILALVQPGAFRIGAGGSSDFLRPGLFRYFSFATLTTLGYGDILPLTPMARSLATLEAVVGQLYPTVMIARLITLELSDRRIARRRRGTADHLPM